MIKKQVVTMTMFSFLLAHNPNAENIEWKDYARFGGVNRGAVKNQIGFFVEIVQAFLTAPKNFHFVVRIEGEVVLSHF